MEASCSLQNGDNDITEELRKDQNEECETGEIAALYGEALFITLVTLRKMDWRRTKNARNPNMIKMRKHGGNLKIE